MRSVITFAALALTASVLIPRYASQSNGAVPASAAISAHAVTPAETASSNSRQVVIAHDQSGHFHVEGHVDGRRLSFMVDTGATVVALTERDAAMLGIHPAQREFSALVKTANGTVRAAPAELNTIEIGDLVVRNVPAIVLPDDALSDNLLGMSFLSRLRHFEYGNGKLVLEQ